MQRPTVHRVRAAAGAGRPGRVTLTARSSLLAQALAGRAGQLPLLTARTGQSRSSMLAAACCRLYQEKCGYATQPTTASATAHTIHPRTGQVEQSHHPGLTHNTRRTKVQAEHHHITSHGHTWLLAAMYIHLFAFLAAPRSLAMRASASSLCLSGSRVGCVSSRASMRAFSAA